VTCVLFYVISFRALFIMVGSVDYFISSCSDSVVLWEKPGDLIKLLEFRPHQHFTEPPPRFSEGTLVSEPNSCVCCDLM